MKRPTAADMLKHRWLADEKPHYVPDPGSPTGGPTNLLPHIQKRLDARTRCECHPSYLPLDNPTHPIPTCSPPRRLGYHCDETHVDACGTG